MRIFAQKQNQPHQRASFNLTRSRTVSGNANYRTDTILKLQRTIGNRAVLRLLQADPKGLEVHSATTSTTRFAHELTHVLQQSRARRRPTVGLRTSESESKHNARSMAQHGPKGDAEQGLCLFHPPPGVMIQRQHAAPPLTSAQHKITQQQYDAAVALISGGDPLMLNYLKKGRVSQRVVVDTFTAPGTRQTGQSPVKVVFVLEVISTGMYAKRDAAFDKKAPSLDMSKSPPEVTTPLPITVNRLPATTNPTRELSNLLFHEGIHMILYRDFIMKSLGQPTGSVFSVPFAAYKSAATSSPHFPDVVGAIAAQITVVPGRPPLTVTRATEKAKSLVLEIVEERFVYDQTQAQMGGKYLSNKDVAVRYVWLILKEEGVQVDFMKGFVEPQIVEIIDEMAALLDDISPMQRAKPAPPLPLPPPLPVIP